MYLITMDHLKISLTKRHLSRIYIEREKVTWRIILLTNPYPCMKLTGKGRCHPSEITLETVKMACELQRALDLHTLQLYYMLHCIL